MTTPAPLADPPGTVRVHPDDPPSAPGACRLVRIATAHPGEWPWRRLTGPVSRVPSQGADLADWPRQPLAELAVVLGHPTDPAATPAQTASSDPITIP